MATDAPANQVRPGEQLILQSSRALYRAPVGTSALQERRRSCNRKSCHKDHQRKNENPGRKRNVLYQKINDLQAHPGRGDISTQNL